MYLTSILFYSNYSNICTSLISSIENCPVNFKNIVGLNYICIDNEKIREQIKRSKQYKLTEVPTLIVVYNNGSLEKLENIMLFNWIDNIVNQNLVVPKNTNVPINYDVVFAKPIENDILENDIKENDIKENNIKENNIKENFSNIEEITDIMEDIDINDDTDNNMNQMQSYIQRNNIRDKDEQDEQDKKKDPGKLKSEKLMAAAAAMQQERVE
tara:strand:+ start:3516 stop:4154 length:639 start_codon:yes stop_codon:yes gene_type:complete